MPVRRKCYRRECPLLDTEWQSAMTARQNDASRPTLNYGRHPGIFTAWDGEDGGGVGCRLEGSGGHRAIMRSRDRPDPLNLGVQFQVVVDVFPLAVKLLSTSLPPPFAVAKEDQVLVMNSHR